MHPIGEAYLKWYHETNVWKRVSYRGIRTLKLPSDMWNYQEIIFEHNIDWVLETGSRHGGSALFFADLLRNAGKPGRVISVDLYPELDPRVVSDPLITFITADSGTAETAYKLQSLLPQNRGKLFMILDSDHSAAHVRKELQVLVPLLKTGDYLLVEDTVINGHPVRPDSGPGPMEAIRDYIKTNPGVLIPDLAREEKFGATFAPEGYYVKG